MMGRICSKCGINETRGPTQPWCRKCKSRHEAERRAKKRQASANADRTEVASYTRPQNSDRALSNGGTAHISANSVDLVESPEITAAATIKAVHYAPIVIDKAKCVAVYQY